jgi:hypothetical protein
MSSDLYNHPLTTVSDTAAARELRLPTSVRDQAARRAEIAIRERHTHLAYLAEVLAAEPTTAPAAATPGASPKPDSRA